jgi:hypothetical protein
MSSSLHLVRLVYDYRSLLGRRDLARLPLEPEEHGRLAAFEGRFAHASLRRRHERLALAGPGQIKVGREFRDVTISDISGGGLLVTPAPALQRGEISVVRIADPAIGREYHLPVQVVWTASGSTVWAGLAFFGIPIELRYGGGRAGLADDVAA